MSPQRPQPLGFASEPGLGPHRHQIWENEGRNRGFLEADLTRTRLLPWEKAPLCAARLPSHRPAVAGLCPRLSQSRAAQGTKTQH